jgi:tripartite-type tricarboxylate transporter receptor subunit TctC
MKKRSQKISFGMIAISLFLLFSGGGSQAAREETYPTRPIEILVVYPAASGADIMARVIANVGLKYLKQPIVVINKVGANGAIAAAEILSSKPDGYKILFSSNFFVSTTVKTQKVPFNPDDLTPLACLFTYKHGIVVRSDSPWKTLGDLVEYARKNPNKLKMGHTGIGSTQHLGLLLVFKEAEVIYIPFRGGAERMLALLGGHIDAGFVTYQNIKNHFRAGKVRILAFFSDRRFSDPSDVPSVLELGYTDAAKLTTLNGLFIHKNTPEEIKRTLINTFEKIYQDPQFKEKLINFGEEPLFGGPEFFNKSIQDAREVGIPLIKKLGLYVEQ